MNIFPDPATGSVTIIVPATIQEIFLTHVSMDPATDVVTIRGELDGVAHVAYGWVSAMTNHYGPECYGPDGHLLEDAVPRAMSETEKDAYWRVLLAAALEPTPQGPLVLHQAEREPAPDSESQ